VLRLERFRTFALNYYQLEPTAYCSAPGLSFDAMLKLTKVKIELLHDNDMLSFVQRAIRGGVSSIFHRHSKSNIPGTEDYEENNQENYLKLYDCVSLYGYAMCQPLPISDYAWLNAGERRTFPQNTLLQTPDDASHGYMVECDIDYPQHLHDFHNQ